MHWPFGYCQPSKWPTTKVRLWKSSHKFVGMAICLNSISLVKSSWFEKVFLSLGWCVCVCRPKPVGKGVQIGTESEEREKNAWNLCVSWVMKWATRHAKHILNKFLLCLLLKFSRWHLFTSLRMRNVSIFDHSKENASQALTLCIALCFFSFFVCLLPSATASHVFTHFHTWVAFGSLFSLAYSVSIQLNRHKRYMRVSFTFPSIFLQKCLFLFDWAFVVCAFVCLDNSLIFRSTTLSRIDSMPLTHWLCLHHFALFSWQTHKLFIHPSRWKGVKEMRGLRFALYE